MSPTNLIKCTSCKKEKDLSEFHRRGNKTQKICKECRNTNARSEYADHGKERKTSPKPINPNNFPVLAERITKLETSLRSMASRFAIDGMDADDIHSEIIDAILRKCKPGDTDAYIMQCARWTAEGHVAKQTTYSARVDLIDVDNEEAEAAGFEVVAARTVEDTLVQREAMAHLEAVIKSLPAENRKVVAMLTIGMSNREIAAELEVSEQSMSERIKKIRLHIRAAFDTNELALIQY